VGSVVLDGLIVDVEDNREGAIKPTCSDIATCAGKADAHRQLDGQQCQRRGLPEGLDRLRAKDFKTALRELERDRFIGSANNDYCLTSGALQQFAE
jgi:hypothetical protein